MGLRVITFNIHHGVGTSGQPELEAQAQLLGDSGADIAFLQEVDVETERSGWADQAKLLAKLAGFPYTCFGRNMDVRGGAYGNAILSKFELTSSTNHPIPLKDPHLPRLLFSGGFHLPEPRGILHATALIRSETVHLLCTHFGFLVNEPLEGSRAMLELIRPLEGPIIFGGDLNAWEERDGEIAPLRELLVDCALALGHEWTRTWPSAEPRKRLDYLFVRAPFQPVGFSTIPTHTSDHRPVLVELSG